MTKKVVMVIIIIGALILYIWGMVIIAIASINGKPTDVNELWVNIVAAVTTVLAMNAGAYLGLPERNIFQLDFKDPETVRGLATIIYVVALFAAFIIAATSPSPHPSLTDMGGTLVGFIAGVLTVFFGRD